MAGHYIALDVRCAFCEAAVLNSCSDFVKQDRCATTIPALLAVPAEIGRPRRVTFDAGPLADRLARELRSHVDQLIVCEPRCHHWIAKNGDKDDPVDARKLAALYRGGDLEEVQQPATLERSLLKQEVLLHHNRVRQDRRLVALFRRQRVFTHVSRMLDPDNWRCALQKLPGAGTAPPKSRRGHLKPGLCLELGLPIGATYVFCSSGSAKPRSPKFGPEIGV